MKKLRTLLILVCLIYVGELKGQHLGFSGNLNGNVPLYLLQNQSSLGLGVKLDYQFIETPFENMNRIWGHFGMYRFFPKNIIINKDDKNAFNLVKHYLRIDTSDLLNIIDYLEIDINQNLTTFSLGISYPLKPFHIDSKHIWELNTGIIAGFSIPKSTSNINIYVPDYIPAGELNTYKIPSNVFDTLQIDINSIYLLDFGINYNFKIRSNFFLGAQGNILFPLYIGVGDISAGGFWNYKNNLKQSISRLKFIMPNLFTIKARWIFDNN